MLSGALVCAAGAVLCCPVRPRRIRGRIRLRRPGLLLGCVLAACWLGLGWLFGIPAGLSAAIAVIVGALRWRSARASRTRATESRWLADGLAGMVAELRRGAHPALAAQTVAEHGNHPMAPVFLAIAESSRIGARVQDGLAARAANLPHVADELTRLASGWRLAAAHGIPLAELLAAIHRDIDHRVRCAAKLRAQLSGARASGWVLAGLPLLGVLLGELIGAGPLSVLFSAGTGGLLLLFGTGLICAGLCWTARLTDKAERS